MGRFFSCLEMRLMRCAQLGFAAAVAMTMAASSGFAGPPSRVGQASFSQDYEPNERGALGVTLGGPSSVGGVTIAGVMPNSPAAEAGLRPGDVLFSIDGVTVASPTEVINFVTVHEPGEQLRLAIDRKGLQGTLRATLATQEDVAKRAALGVTLSKSAHGGGVRVLQIVRGSPADKAGLKIGDRIVSINEEPATSYGELIQLIGQMQPGADMKIGVDRYGLEGTLHASLTGLPQVFSAPRPVVRPPVAQPAVPIFELTPADIDDQRGYGD